MQSCKRQALVRFLGHKQAMSHNRLRKGKEEVPYAAFEPDMCDITWSVNNIVR